MDNNPEIPNDEIDTRPRISRAVKRKILHSKSIMRDLLRVIHSYFPNLIDQLSRVEDPRNKNYTTFDISVLLIERILSAIFSIGSMREQTFEFNNENMIKNVAAILGQENLDELPCHDTINNCFKKLKPSELEAIIKKMIIALTQRNTFNNSRIRGKYWQILIDATMINSSKHKYDDKCLFKRHKNGKGEVTSVEFYHYVLEAKLVIHENLVFSICTVFVDNEDGIPCEEELYSSEYDEPGREKMKQNCELKAFHTLSEKLKSAFPRLPICITADGLYPCKQVFEICRNNNWCFILRFKEGCIPNLYDSYCREKKLTTDQSLRKSSDGHTFNYFYAGGLAYANFILNFAECKDSGVNYPFLFVTDLPVLKDNCESTVMFGRRRWRIENEGFKVQKHHGYSLTHVFCRDYNATKIHYYLIQIAHAISQLLEHSSDALKILKLTMKLFHEELKKCFQQFILTADDIDISKAPKKIRLIA